MRLHLALPLHAALLFAAIDAARQRPLPLSINVDDTGSPVPDPNIETSNNEERTVTEIVEEVKKGISAAFLRLLEFAGRGGKPQENAALWKAHDEATRKRIIKHEQQLRRYKKLALKDRSGADMVSKLTTHHVKDDMASWIKAMKGIDNKEVEIIAAGLQAWEIQNLADDAFVSRGLHVATLQVKSNPSPYYNYEWCFGDSRFASWYADVKAIDMHDPAMTMIKTLTRFLGDKFLAHALILAKVNPETKVMATELQTAQIKFWVRQKVDLTSVKAWMEMDEPDFYGAKYFLYERYVSVFPWSGLDRATQDTLFRHEEVMQTYMEISGGDMSDADKLMELKALHAKDTVASALFAVKDVKDERLKSGAARLLNEQFEEWKSHEDSSDHAFKDLALDKRRTWEKKGVSSLAEKAASLFLDPKFAIWEAFLDRVTNKDPKMKIAEMIRTLERVYRLAGSVKLFSAAKQIESLNELAKRLQTSQIELWISRNVHPDDICDFMAVEGAAYDDEQIKLLHIYKDTYTPRSYKGWEDERIRIFHL
uniref:RxLR effector candidate protein n=1 Tax=Peronospora matthiolae TaxID=2874970 RepID=A0AAV1UN80_9STRA